MLDWGHAGERGVRPKMEVKAKNFIFFIFFFFVRFQIQRESKAKLKQKKRTQKNVKDAVICEPEFDVPQSKCTSGHHSLFAVFDGHGGLQCAEFCKKQFPQLLAKYLRTKTELEQVKTLFPKIYLFFFFNLCDNLQQKKTVHIHTQKKTKKKSQK